VMEDTGKKARLSKEAFKDLKKSVKLIIDMYSSAVEAMESGDEMSIKNIQKQKEEVMLLDDKMRRNHIARVGKKKCNVKLTPLYYEILHNIDRMGNSCVNLVEMAQNGMSFQLLLNNEVI
ncbi:MAG: PhoU domain-containing protein, partial [Agathobacter sp.]|nr:PhoU domain-containing protein [Agathobacter sp.]